MKHKTAELEGDLLHDAVAKAEGVLAFYTSECYTGSPCEDWEIGGPIIEREGLWLSCSDVEDGREWFASFSPHTECYGEDDKPEIKRIFKARQPLMAAMRAYVASKFGDEVEL